MAFVRCPECRTEIESLVPAFNYLRTLVHMDKLSKHPNILPENISLVENVEDVTDYGPIFDALGVSLDRICCRLHLTTKCDYMEKVVQTGIISTMH